MAVSLNQRDTKFLLCSVCREYLSCGPVIIKRERYSICGRCSSNNTIDKGIRNRYYEVAAKNLRFPCRYRSYGCKESQLFSETYVQSHEYSCEYKTYKCIFWGKHEEPCAYVNLKSKLADHVQLNHPANLLYNCCTLDIKFNRSNEHTYLLIAFDMQFLLYIRVIMSISTKKMELGLELLGYQKAASEFQYSINIKKDRSMVTKLGTCKVLPNRSIIHYDNLKDLFGGMRDVSFHFTISVKCNKCETELIYGKLHNEGSVWYCMKCAPQLVSCENKMQGCSFRDHPVKICKHEEYYCKFANSNLMGIRILNYGKIWRVKSDNDKCAFTTDVGLVLCEFTATRTSGNFEIFLWSPLKFDQQKEFGCQINVGNPLTGESVIEKPKFNEYMDYDWYLSIDKKEHPSWGAELAVFICVQRKINNPTFDESVALVL